MTNPNPAAPLTEAGRRMLGLYRQISAEDIIAIEQEAAARATSTPAGLTAKTILQTIAEAEKGWAALLAVDTSHLPTITHDEYVAQWLDYYLLQGADR